MNGFRTLLPLLAGLTFSLAVQAAPPPADAGIKQAGPTCESCCCKKMDGGKGCGQGQGHGMGMGMRDPQAMQEHMKQMQEQRAIAAELKKASSDKQRIKLMQRYIEGMDAHMGEMLERMEKMHGGGETPAQAPASDPHAGHH